MNVSNNQTALVGKDKSKQTKAIAWAISWLTQRESVFLSVWGEKTASSYLLLLLTSQLHLLPLFLHLRGGELLLLVVSGQELLPQADQLSDHSGELVLLFGQALRSTCREDGEEERENKV